MFPTREGRVAAPSALASMESGWGIVAATASSLCAVLRVGRVYQCWLSGRSGQNHAEFGDVRNLQPHPIKAICDIDFRKMDGPIAEVGFDHLFRGPIQSTAKLHGFLRYQWDGFGVDCRESVIDNKPGATIPLRNHAQRRYPQVRPVPHVVIRQYDPVALLAKAVYFVEDKFPMVSC